MKSNGIPEDQIIVFAYDDIANSRSNPLPGRLFNQPDGKDVYAGCKIDYAGKDVTPANFLKVIKGEAMPDGGKTLKTNKNSKIFINYSDHGAPGLIAFPKGNLYATDMNDAFKWMHENELYNEMVVYIEACHSASMFENLLPTDINVYGTVAANAHESSWGYYCSSADKVEGKSIGTCLGDEYSIHWMEDSDAHDACKETLDEQFSFVQFETKKSDVLEFGDLTFKKEVIGNFEGVCDAKKSPLETFFKKALGFLKKPTREGERVNSRDIKLHYMMNKFIQTGLKEDQIELQAELDERTNIEDRFEKLITNNSHVLFEDRPTLQDHTCYEQLVEQYHQTCVQGEYDLKYFYHFVSLCNVDMSQEDRVKTVTEMC